MSLLRMFLRPIVTGFLLLNIIFTFVLIAFAVIQNVPVQAQSIHRGLIISPAIMEVEANRGQAYNLTINLTNDTVDQDYKVTSIIQTFGATNEEGVPAVTDFPKDNDISSWISASEANFGLTKGLNKDFNFILAVPANATPGDHYFAMTFAPSVDSQDNSTNVKLEERIVALLFVTVQGKIDRTAQITSLQADKQIYDPFFDPIVFSYKIKVDGNSYLKPSGNIFVGTNADKPDNTLTMNPDQKIVLPNTTRSFQFAIAPTWNVAYLNSGWPSVPAHAASEISPANITDNFKKPWFGNQKILAKILYVNSDGELSQSSADLYVFFFPWKLLLIQGVLLLAIISLWFLRRKYARNQSLKKIKTTS